MKKLLFGLLGLIGLLMCHWASAAPLKIVYHLNEMEKATIVISSIREILKTYPDAEIIAVIHGPAIIRLAKSDGLMNEFKDLLESGVEIGACNTSILKSSLRPGLMVEGVTLLSQGGVQKIIELQQLGYIYIKI